MKPRNRHQKQRKKFTILELMIVVSVIVILIAILIPALKKARDKAGQILCTGNLRQMGVAGNAYADDQDDFFVPLVMRYSGNSGDAICWYTNRMYLRYLTGRDMSTSGYNSLYGKYYGNVSSKMVCPASATARNEPEKVCLQSAYGMNMHTFVKNNVSILNTGFRGVYSYKRSRITAPSRRFCFMGGSSWVSRVSKFSVDSSVRYWHQDGNLANTVFFDTHVKPLSRIYVSSFAEDSWDIYSKN